MLSHMLLLSPSHTESRMNTDHQGLQSMFIRVVILVSSVFIPCLSLAILGDPGYYGVVRVDPGSQHDSFELFKTAVFIRVHPALNLEPCLSVLATCQLRVDM